MSFITANIIPIITFLTGLIGLLASWNSKRREDKIKKDAYDKGHKEGYDTAIAEINTSTIYAIQMAKETSNEINKLTPEQLREFNRSGMLPARNPKTVN